MVSINLLLRCGRRCRSPTFLADPTIAEKGADRNKNTRSRAGDTKPSSFACTRGMTVRTHLFDVAPVSALQEHDAVAHGRKPSRQHPPHDWTPFSFSLFLSSLLSLTLAMKGTPRSRQRCSLSCLTPTVLKDRIATMVNSVETSLVTVVRVD